MLRALVELVLHVVSTFQMNHNRPLGDWHTGPVDASLPRTENDTRQREPLAARQDSPTTLMVSSNPSRSDGLRPSHREPSVHEAVELVRWSEERFGRDGLIRRIKPSDERRSDSEGSSDERPE